MTKQTFMVNAPVEANHRNDVGGFMAALKEGVRLNGYEKMVCTMRVERMQSVKSRFILALTVAIHAFAWIPEWSLSDGENFAYLLAQHVGYVLVGGLALFHFKTRENLLKTTQWLLNFVVVASYAAAAHTAFEDLGALSVKGASILVGCSCFAILFTPFIDWRRHITPPVCFAICATATYGFPNAHRWWVVTAFIFATTWGILLISHFFIIRGAREAYRHGTLAAPAHIVAQSIIDATEIDRSFAPAKRHCACLAIGLRATSTVANDDATEAFDRSEAFYRMLDQTLPSHFKQSDYYCDLHANELFIVIFARSPSASFSEIIEETLAYCHRLTREAAAQNLALGVGASAGELTVGILGPSGRKKTTAIGEAAGQAARLRIIAQRLSNTKQRTSYVAVSPSLSHATTSQITKRMTSITPSELKHRYGVFLDDVDHLPPQFLLEEIGMPIEDVA